MDFELSSEQKLLRDTVRSFVKQKSPVDRFRRTRDERKGWDPAIWTHMGELGWLSIPFPEDIGGFGGGMVEVALLMEGLGSTLVPEPYVPSVVAAGLAALEAGSGEQHEWLLVPMMEGRTSLALAYAERNTRFGLDSVETTASRDGDGWRLRGEKVFVLNGHRADELLVLAGTSAGPALFAAARDTDGLEIVPVRTIDGHGAASIRLDCHLPENRRLGTPGDATVRAVELALDCATAAACAEAVGVCHRVLEMTSEHLKTREQFGVPIGTFQVLQHYTVDMFVQVELMRSMSLLAAMKARDPDDQERRRAISAAKAHIARSGRKVTQQAIQIHGGIGITDEHDVGLYFKRMHALSVVFGDEAHHVHRFASLPGFA